MESSERRRIKQNRRKERAEKVEKERSEVTNDDPDDDNVGPPVKKPRRKPRKPCPEEDIIDGFAILAFKSFEDLTRAINVGTEESDHKQISCLHLMKREGGDNKTIETDKKIKKPKTNCALSTQQFKENGEIMVDKVPGIDIKTTTAPSGNPYPHPKKLGRMNGPSSKDALHNLICENDDIGDKIADGCSDLFAASRKDSSPKLPDNLHSSNEPKGVDIQRHHQNNCEKKPLSPSATTVNSLPSQVTQVKSRVVVESPLGVEPSQANGPDSRAEDINGHVEKLPAVQPPPPPPPPVQQKPTVPQTLFTPYAITSITKVKASTPIAPAVVSSQSCIPESLHDPNQSHHHSAHLQHSHSQRVNRNHISASNLNVQNSTGDLTSGSHSSSIRHSGSPVVEKIGQHKSSNSSSSPVPGQNRKSLTPSGKVTPTTTTSKSAAFGSIARLLDSPSTSRSSPTVNATVTTSTNYNSFNHQNQSFGGGLLNGSSSHNQNSAQVTCSLPARSHSPRGHSPSRERDSYSSNVSSLSRESRTSVTPVSGSSQLPPTLSPLQNLQSYSSKAASWLSTVPGLSPRPAPPPPHSSSNSSGLISGSSQYSPAPISAPSPHSVFPGLVPGAPHSSAMFAPPILPLSSISQHPSGHPSPFGPDALFHGSSTSSELVRRDLESRFLSSERNLTGPSFMTRPGDLHHHLLPPLSGVNHLPPQSPFPPPLFKDLPKIGLDSPFYRTNMAMSYPGFNGILPNLATPFAPPNQIAAFTPKITDACKPAKVMKSGRWNAMHVRIAWEIYHDQQKGGGESKSRNSSSPATKGSALVSTSNSRLTESSSNNTIAPPPPPNTELLRQPPHGFGLGRPPEVGPSGSSFAASALLSPHHTAPPPPSPHSLFLNSAPQGYPYGIPRYPGFSLGQAYGGLSGLGSSGSFCGPPSLVGPTAAQEHWHRSHRGPPYAALGTGWPMQRPERDVKTPNESRRHKDDHKRSESHHTPDSGRGDLSPFRDRSPVRPSRTPLEQNGDTDSRSSDSHSVHASSNSKTSGRIKDETNGDFERDKILHQLSSDSKHQSLISATHPSRLFHPPGGSPLTTPITSGWESFPGISSAPRMSSAESFRLSLLQLSERDRELSRIPHAQIRPPNIFSNGPFGMSLGHPGSSGNSKNNPSGGGPIPLLNSSSIAAAAHNHLLHSSSLNGPHSPSKHDEMNSAHLIRTKEESQSR